jgi:hypothetical protein
MKKNQKPLSPQQKAANTRKANKEKRSNAAKKAWDIRRQRYGENGIE